VERQQIVEVIDADPQEVLVAEAAERVETAFVVRRRLDHARELGRKRRLRHFETRQVGPHQIVEHLGMANQDL
jgi:hypothetical protein